MYEWARGISISHNNIINDAVIYYIKMWIVWLWLEHHMHLGVKCFRGGSGGKNPLLKMFSGHVWREIHSPEGHFGNAIRVASAGGGRTTGGDAISELSVRIRGICECM